MRKRLLFTPVAAGAVLVAGGGFALAQLGASPASAAQVHVVKFGEYFYRPEATGGPRRRPGALRQRRQDPAHRRRLDERTDPQQLDQAAATVAREVQTVTFHSKGTVPLCTFHPQLMRGVIVVR